MSVHVPATWRGQASLGATAAAPPPPGVAAAGGGARAEALAAERAAVAAELGRAWSDNGLMMQPTSHRRHRLFSITSRLPRGITGSGASRPPPRLSFLRPAQSYAIAAIEAARGGARARGLGGRQYTRLFARGMHNWLAARRALALGARRGKTMRSQTTTLGAGRSFHPSRGGICLASSVMASESAATGCACAPAAASACACGS